jgi:hypothetical protein
MLWCWNCWGYKPHELKGAEPKKAFCTVCGTWTYVVYGDGDTLHLVKMSVEVKIYLQ